MKKGEIILCPVYSIGRVPKAIVGEALTWELINKQGRYFLKYRVREQDLGLTYYEILFYFYIE